MNAKQIKAAQRQLATLLKIRQQLNNTTTAGCFTLQQVTEKALESNLDCIRIIEDRLRVESALNYDDMSDVNSTANPIHY